MKINVARILVSHLSTLKDARTGRISFGDIFIFYLMPCLLAGLVYYYDLKFEKEIFSQSIAVFAIFSALLFSVQVALFGIYAKKREAPDEFGVVFSEERLTARRELIAETNSNISYLIVLSAISVTLFLLAYSMKVSDRFEPSLAVFLYLHFMLTLLMVIKRVHALFEKEYLTD